MIEFVFFNFFFSFSFIEMTTESDVIGEYPHPPRHFQAFCDMCYSPEPPAIPTEPFTVFGETIDPSGPVSSVPDSTATPERIRLLSRAAVANYVQLLDAIAENPSAAKQKVDDLRSIFVEAQKILAEYRPWQAREELVKTMEQQCERKRKAIAELKSAMKETQDAIRTGIEEASAPINTK